MLKMYIVLSMFVEVMSRFGNVYDIIMIVKVRVCVYWKMLVKVCDICRKSIISLNFCDFVLNCKFVLCINFVVFDLEYLICC